MNHTYLSITLLVLTIGSAPQLTAQKSLLNVNLNEITVAANRDSIAHIKSPRQIISIPASEIEYANCQNTADLLMSIGQVAVQKSQQGGGSPILRGFEASRVLLVNDGIRMNNLIYRSGHLQNVITIDQFMQDGVEVVNGPSSLHYGSDAMGGAILFKSKQPRLSLSDRTIVSGNAVMRYSSANNEGTGHLDLNVGTKHFASLTSATFSQFGDLKSGRNRNPFLPDDDQYIECVGYVIPGADGTDQFVQNDKTYLQYRSGYIQYDITQKFLFTPDSENSHSIDFQLSNTNNFNRYDRLSVMTEKNGVITPKYAEWYYGPQFRLMADYRYTGKNKLGADVVKAIVAYQRVKESRHNRKYNDPLLYHTWEAVDMISLNTDWIKSVGNHSVHGGVDISSGFLKSTAQTDNLSTGEITDNTTRYPNGNNSMHMAEAFITHEWSINPKLTMNDGIRIGMSMVHSTVKDVTEFPFFGGKSLDRNNFTYSLAWGLNYLPTNRWKLAFSAATAYRAPNIDNTSKIFESKLSTVTIPNASLKPEKTISADINITRYVGNTLVFENVIYGTYLFDAITTGQGSLNGSTTMTYEGVDCDIYTSVNNERAVIWGYSGTITYKPTRNLLFDATYNYTYGRIISGEHKPLDHIPPMYGRVGAAWIDDNGKLRFDIYSIYNSHKRKSTYNFDGEDNIEYATQKGEDGEGTPAWFTLNIKGSWQIKKDIKLLAGIENILDTEYRTFASGINAPGRNIYTTIHLSF